MKALASFILSTTIFNASLWAGREPVAPWNVGKPTDDPVYPPVELVEAFHRAFGNHDCRAIHAKGIILEGEFTPDSHAKELTRAPHLQTSASKVTVRFSNFSGVPNIPDNDPLANPRGLAVRFGLPDGKSTDLIAHSYNGFPVSNTDDFREIILALAASRPGAGTPTPFDSFLETHPVARKFMNAQKTPVSFASIAYYGIGSFKFISSKGQNHYVRYLLWPEAGEELLTPQQAERETANYLIDDMKARVAQAPVAFELYAQVAEAGDKIKDPSIAWPDDRKRVLLGRLRLNKVTANTPEEDKALVFNPANVPSGIETADGTSSFYSKIFRLSVNRSQAAATPGDSDAIR